MEMLNTNAVKDELLKSNPTFRELINQHQGCEKRLTELAHLTYPNDDEVLEESTLKKKKLQIKDEIYAMMQKYGNSH